MNKDVFLKTTNKFWEGVAEGFEQQANFPHCIGAVDGKHIRIIRPEMSGSLYFNYKEFFSIVLMAIADSQYRFLYVDVGSYGKDADSTIFKRSSFWNMLQSNLLCIPKENPLNENGGISTPFVLVGDEGFPLHTNLMRPFGGTHLDITKRIFNYRLTRARRYVQCAFGILTNKWRIFHRPLNVSNDFAIKIVKACVILHNFVRRNDGYNFEDTLTHAGLYDSPRPETTSTLRGSWRANAVRKNFAHYFMNDTSVPWQFNNI